MKTKISVAIAVHNEEKNLPRVLASVKDWADEVVVADGNSSDSSVEVAKKLGAKVIKAKHEPMFHKNKQKAIDACKNEWVLLLDADEEVSKELRQEVGEVLNHQSSIINHQASGYWAPRKNIIFGKWMEHTGWWPDYQLRLFKKDAIKFPCKSVHEDPVLSGESAKLENPLLHYHYQSISQFVERMNRYTDSDARLLHEKGEKIKWSDAIVWSADEFIKRYLVWEGYKDGLHGLVLSLLQALSRVLVFAKIWEKNKFKEENSDIMDKQVLNLTKNKIKEYKWWQKEKKINNSKSTMGKYFHKVTRKIIK